MVSGGDEMFGGEPARMRYGSGSRRARDTIRHLQPHQCLGVRASEESRRASFGSLTRHCSIPDLHPKAMFAVWRRAKVLHILAAIP